MINEITTVCCVTQKGNKCNSAKKTVEKASNQTPQAESFKFTEVKIFTIEKTFTNTETEVNLKDT